MPKLLCSQCKSSVRSNWNHCSQCGQKLEKIERVNEERKQSGGGAFLVAGGLILALVLLPLVNIFNEKNGDLLSRLENRGVLSWIEDKASDAVLSAGEYTPEIALMTATGSCRLWIYPDLESADKARDNYINDNIDFSASWSGIDKATNTGVVLLTLEPNSYCSEEAASFLDWTLE